MVRRAAQSPVLSVRPGQALKRLQQRLEPRVTAIAAPSIPAEPVPASSIHEALSRYWGYTSLRPLQQEAIEAGVSRRDSLVVLPTGGGKSLCYQVPPVVAARTDVVVSPLISLMKDQVDALRANGYEAAAMHSNLMEQERSDIARDLVAGKLKLLFVSPERLLTNWFIMLLKRARVTSFAIDEAHCISQWGHDFRPEYRRLAELREHFPEASIHAFTATATERVRQDIIDQLKLKAPNVLVGRFDRPNLTYRVVQREKDARAQDLQLIEAVRAHAGEAVIVYCISRADTERIAELLKSKGIKAAAYHAGLDARTRSRTQEAFTAEKLDVVVATVAFGMGIDRSNVRCVIHAAMPKSVEHYQQETGRAGRDGLEAECVLFFGNGDYRRWERLMTRSADETSQPPEFTTAQLALVGEMYGFANNPVCRHRQLSEYFGQRYTEPDCKACDVCLSNAPEMDGGDDIARSVIGCVQALRASYGVGYVVDVLRGSMSERIESRRHDKLPQFGTLKAMTKEQVQKLVYQMVGLGLLERTEGDRPVLLVTEEGRAVAAGKAHAHLKTPVSAPARKQESEGWRGVDRGLFEVLRALRREIAEERDVPPFVVFSDAVLRDMAEARPRSMAEMGAVKGVGERKLAELGPRFLEAISTHAQERREATHRTSAAGNASKVLAFQLFEQSRSLDEVVSKTGRARGTILSYLEDYVAERRPASVSAWVDDITYARVRAAAERTPGSFLKPVFEALGGTVDYNDIRVAMKHLGRR
jgi:ATP-dependent DNA helicase RecQ